MLLLLVVCRVEELDEAAYMAALNKMCDEDGVMVTETAVMRLQDIGDAVVQDTGK